MNETAPLSRTDLSAPTAPTPPITTKPKINIYFVTTIISALLLLGISFAYAFQLGKKNTSIVALPTPTLHPNNFSPTPIPSTPPITSAPTLTDKIIWLDKPQKISPIDVFIPAKPDSGGYVEYYVDKARYYQTATLPDGSKLINVFLPTEGMGVYDVLYRFTKTADNKIYFVDSDNQWENNKSKFSKNVTLSSFSLRDLSPPESLSFDNLYFKRGYLQQGLFDKLDNPKLIKETEYGNFYVVYSPYKENSDISGRMFYLRLKDWTYYSYDYRVYFMNDNQVANLQWSDGTNDQPQLLNKLQRGGCGQSLYPGADVIKDGSALLNSKEVVASNGNNKIYQIKDSSSYIVKTIYEQYKVGRDYPSAPPVLSLDDFIKAKNHILYQDSFGDWQLFVNQTYAPMAECGKPVIYLYPTKDTEVSVKVGANITVSEPKYPQNGWTVLAHSNGQLDYQNQTYPNLFWEGTGFGVYPDKSKYGIVVPQSKLISTLISQLTQLGLNAQESADFMEFWTDKLPLSPYVRLTWLDTQDMNVLAPLQVSPLPKTSIRIFLEFQGLEKPIGLIPQNLSSPARDGFTLVEWGGLLRR